ncbi:hypothetical protein QUA62_27360 [Microcoleus sp. MON1_C1]|jgi:hypothetical protein|uniref:hypothetical protein n=1 Tax=Microcoleus sp. MON1_C1 TaxID=2818827 RepID=UPI002FCF1C42
MTGSFHLVYKEIYKDQSIEIYCFSQFMPGGIGSSHYYAIIDDYTLPGNFDCRSHNPFLASEDTGNQPTPEHSLALAAAKAYCEREAEALERRGDELLSLSLSYREAKTLLRAIRVAWKHEQIATHNLGERIEVLLQEPSAVGLTRPTNLLSRALTKIRRSLSIE